MQQAQPQGTQQPINPSSLWVFGLSLELCVALHRPIAQPCAWKMCHWAPSHLANERVKPEQGPLTVISLLCSAPGLPHSARRALPEGQRAQDRGSNAQAVQRSWSGLENYSPRQPHQSMTWPFQKHP